MNMEIFARVNDHVVRDASGTNYLSQEYAAYMAREAASGIAMGVFTKDVNALVKWKDMSDEEKDRWRTLATTFIQRSNEHNGLSI